MQDGNIGSGTDRNDMRISTQSLVQWQPEPHLQSSEPITFASCEDEVILLMKVSPGRLNHHKMTHIL